MECNGSRLLRISAGFVCNPGMAAREAKEQEKDKFKDLIDNGYLFKTFLAIQSPWQYRFRSPLACSEQKKAEQISTKLFNCNKLFF